MPKFRKRPIIVEAFRWTADINQKEDPLWIIDAIKDDIIYVAYEGTPRIFMMIKTLEGTMTAKRGDWIIKGIEGEIYPCKPDIFKKTYELIEE